jgi:phosphohistidine phosphatase
MRTNGCAASSGSACSRRWKSYGHNRQQQQRRGRCAIELYIVRHAYAGERDPEQWPDDRLRPLTPKGERKFRRAAEGLGILVPGVDVVLSSSWVRAWRTAEILERRACWPAPERLAALEAAPPAPVVAALASYGSGDAIALVGHEPFLGWLASYLLTGDPHHARLTLKKGAALALDVEGSIGLGKATLRWLLQPRVLRAIADE